jgi:SAM-dependent methyltransferase
VVEHQYVFGQSADQSERERLALLERTLDPLSQRRLVALGVQPGWRCLEVGAGRGSVVRWLAAQVGPRGRVVATDINLRFLAEVQLPNVEVRQHDIRTDPLETGMYDLAHCRAVLMHVPDPERVVGRLVEALRIGGWLLIEETDLSSSRGADASHPLTESFNRERQELADRIARAKLFDPYLGRRVRGFLDGAGLTEIETEGVNHIVRGGEPEAQYARLSLQAFVERGALEPGEFGALQRGYLDPSFRFITRTNFGAWGQRRR